MVEKQCTACGEKYPATPEFFVRRSRARDGLTSWCKRCLAIDSKERRQTPQRQRRELEWRNANKERRTEYMRQWHVQHRSERAKYAAEYHANHRERRAAERKQWRNENRERVRAYDRFRRQIPRVRLADNVGRAIRHSLLNGKGSASWESLVDFTTDELRIHLESLFEPGMTWDNFGRGGWEIDHVRPRSSFIFASSDDPDFKECWALSNLQPLWWYENLLKSNQMPGAIAVAVGAAGGPGV